MKKTVFCDWLSIRQVHQIDLPEIHNGKLYSVDVEGNIETCTLKGLNHEGSHATTVHVRCDGRTVQLSGNVGRFGRADNVFGYSVADCVDIANRILQSLGLPIFFRGTSMLLQDKKGKPVQVWTGARVSRIDLTRNLISGSESNAASVMNYFSSHKMTRLKQRTYGHDETIEFGGGDKGSGSRYVYAKIYQKHIEMEKHRAKLKRRNKATDDEYIDTLIAWAKSVGLIRVEVELKSNYLTRHAISYLGDITENKLKFAFDKYYNQMMVRVDKDMEEENIAEYCKGTFARWKTGESPSVFLKRPTFYRHRAEIIKAGWDIAEPYNQNIIKFPVKIRVIDLKPASPPDFYSFQRTA